MTQSEFEHIASMLRSQMLKVALDFFGSRDDAEDVTQDAMIQLWHYCEHRHVEPYRPRRDGCDGDRRRQ